MAFLLDTNAWIYYLKNATGPVALKLSSLQPSDIVTCAIVRSELLHGAEKYGNRERRRGIVVRALAPFKSEPFDDSAADVYASLRHSLEVAGQAIGPYDLQIAAICLVRGHTLVTDNVREFVRVQNLRVENWQDASTSG